ncbi:MAG TPA: hypothetical protein PKG52_03560 [bacterium]|nr:hypothetical protein [bacterium]HPS28924.1 hypothetical protein [bacterium]
MNNLKKIFNTLLFVFITFIISCDDKNSNGHIENIKNDSPKISFFYRSYSEIHALTEILLNENDQDTILELIKNAKEIPSDQRPKCKNIEASEFILKIVFLDGKNIEYIMSTCDVLMETKTKKYFYSEEINDFFTKLLKNHPITEH